MSLFKNNTQDFFQNNNKNYIQNINEQNLKFSFDIDGIDFLFKLSLYTELLGEKSAMANIYLKRYRKKPINKYLLSNQTEYEIKKSKKKIYIYIGSISITSHPMDVYIFFNTKYSKKKKKQFKSIYKNFCENFINSKKNDNKLKNLIINFLMNKNKYITVEAGVFEDFLKEFKKFIWNKNLYVKKKDIFLIGETYGLKNYICAENPDQLLIQVKKKFTKKIHKYINVDLCKKLYYCNDIQDKKFVYLGMLSNYFNEKVPFYKPFFINELISYNLHTKNCRELNILRDMKIFKINLYNSMIYNLIDKSIRKKKYPELSSNVLLNTIGMLKKNDMCLDRYKKTLDMTLNFIEENNFNYDFRLEIKIPLTNFENGKAFFTKFEKKHFCIINLDYIYMILKNAIKNLQSILNGKNTQLINCVLNEIFITESVIKGGDNSHIVPRKLFEKVKNTFKKKENIDDIDYSREDEKIICQNLLTYTKKLNKKVKKKSKLLLNFILEETWERLFYEIYIDDFKKQFKNFDENILRKTDKDYKKKISVKLYFLNITENDQLTYMNCVKALNMLLKIKKLSFEEIGLKIKMFLWENKINYLFNFDNVKNKNHRYVITLNKK